jgi:hypothetical protein
MYRVLAYYSVGQVKSELWGSESRIRPTTTPM